MEEGWIEECERVGLGVGWSIERWEGELIGFVSVARIS